MNYNYEEYLKPFAEWITAQAMAPKTIRRHINRTEAFLDYLAYHSNLDSEEVPVTNELLVDGEKYLDSFFGYYMQHTLQATVGTLGEYASSLKKFYKWLAISGNVSMEVTESVLRHISTDIAEWRENLQNYEDEWGNDI